MIIYGLACIFLALFALSWSKVKGSAEKVSFIYSWAFFTGSFIWEDLFMFSFFNVIFLALSFAINDYRFLVLQILLFWIIRSFGEMLYFFLQQFIQPTFPPHNIHAHFKAIRSVLGDLSDQKYFILAQVFYQCLMVIFSSALIFFLLHWSSIGVLRIH